MSDEFRRIIEEAKKQDPYALFDDEEFWRDIQPWLEQQGYMLRPRYRPGWVASWKGNKKSPFSCEDREPLFVSPVTEDTFTC
jgi:hypothetical protein